MKNLIVATSITLAFAFCNAVFAAPPEVSNIRAAQRIGTKLIDIYYDLADPEGDPTTVAITLYDNTTPIPVFSISGDVGMNVLSGASKHIVWNAGQDWNRRYTIKGKARVVADDAPTTSPSLTMSFCPAGFSNPGVEIYTSGFFMDKTEVSKTVWDTVYNWALANGYTFSTSGVAAASNHPITGMNWYDAVKWCNARSQKEGLTPCYYTDLAQTQVYKTGEPLIDNNWVSWTTNGYRLPTRAEWLKAYWGGNYSGFFPWPSYGGTEGNHLGAGLANYTYSGDPFENGGIGTTPVGYYNGTQIPQGPNMANGYGLYDVAGNVGEWTWGRELSNWYTLAEAQDDNSKGPNTGLGQNRCISGQHDGYASSFRSQFYVAASSKFYYPSNGYGNTAVGFRCVRSR